ncbi:MAG: radical SAM protein, partial [Gemmatimonadetes bacterium]|nr:radical SAM protein [Gemmatimonadota bacterium]
RVLERIRAAGRLRVPRLVLSGGEPTVNPHLEAYIHLAKEVGIQDVSLMTNAVRLEEPGVAESLRAAGLDRVFVSLHAPDAALSDRLTRAPGTRRLDSPRQSRPGDSAPGRVGVRARELAGGLSGGGAIGRRRYRIGCPRHGRRRPRRASRSAPRRAADPGAFGR